MEVMRTQCCSWELMVDLEGNLVLHLQEMVELPGMIFGNNITLGVVWCGAQRGKEKLLGKSYVILFCFPFFFLGVKELRHCSWLTYMSLTDTWNIFLYFMKSIFNKH